MPYGEAIRPKPTILLAVLVVTPVEQPICTGERNMDEASWKRQIATAEEIDRMAEAAFEHGNESKRAKDRRARYLARVRAEGRRLRTASEILAEPRDDPDPPSDQELDAFIEAIYEARDRDRDRA